MQKFLSYLFLVIVSVGLQIATMIYGWGLHPQSWWWIIGCGIFGTVFVRTLFDKLEKEGKKEK